MKTGRHSLTDTPAGEFWRTFWGAAIRPWQTLSNLENDRFVLRKGIVALLFVLVIYTFILGIFIARDYPAAAPAVLPLPVETLYRAEIWYMGPLFFFTTLVTAGLLVLITHALGETAVYPLVFARISFASTVPFAFTTMLVEAIIALLVLFQVRQPEEILKWLMGTGSWFANSYQVISGIWVMVLFIIVARQTVKRDWVVTVLVGLAALITYAVPVGLFIR